MVEKKRKFVNFGIRHQLIDESEPIFGNSITIWKTKYEKIITDTLINKNIDQCILFGEYFGPNSFAGYLDLNDIYDIMIFDCSIDNKLITQSDFTKLLKCVEISPIIYEGKPSVPFINSIKNGELEGQTFEGVVCKGSLDNRGRPVMFKVKSNSWYERLKLKCRNDEELFEKLK